MRPVHDIANGLASAAFLAQLSAPVEEIAGVGHRAGRSGGSVAALQDGEARGEQVTLCRRRAAQLARGTFGIALPEQRVHARILVRLREIAAVHGRERSFRRGAHFPATPCFQRPAFGRGAVFTHQRQRVVRLGIVGDGIFVGEETQQDSGLGELGTQALFGAGAQRGFVRETGVR